MTEVPCPGPGWKKNPGKQPRSTRGKRVRVALENGNIAKEEGTTTAPPGWSADKARWERQGFDFDIAWYLLL